MHAFHSADVYSLTRLLLSFPHFLCLIRPRTQVARSGGADNAADRALVPNYPLCVLPPICQVECPGGGPCGIRRPAIANPGFIA